MQSAPQLSLPLHAAIQGGDSHALHELINGPWWPSIKDRKDAKDSYGRTALHIAAANGLQRCVEMLIAAGCDPSIPDVSGRTALKLAEEKALPYNAIIAQLANSRGVVLPPQPSKPLPIPISVPVLAVPPKHFSCLNGHFLNPTLEPQPNSFRCDDCGVTGVEGERRFKCECCDFDRCIGCVAAKKGVRCGNGHTLRRFVTVADGFHCDVCRLSYPEGTAMASCRDCNMDTCFNCMCDLSDNHVCLVNGPQSQISALLRLLDPTERSRLDAHGRNALHIAALTRNNSNIDALISAGYDVTRADAYGGVPVIIREAPAPSPTPAPNRPGYEYHFAQRISEAGAGQPKEMLCK